MTQEEADQIGLIIGTADRGCEYCVQNLCDRMDKAFPEWEWAMTDHAIMELPEWLDGLPIHVGWVVTATPREDAQGD